MEKKCKKAKWLSGEALQITVFAPWEGKKTKKWFSIGGWGIDLDYCDTEWFTLEMNRDHSVIFETAPK